MKRLLPILLALVLIVGLSACAEKPTTPSVSPDASSAAPASPSTAPGIRFSRAVGVRGAHGLRGAFRAKGPEGRHGMRLRALQLDAARR